MLARLDSLDGVAESRCDATGRYFLVALRQGADEGAVVRGAVEALRGRGRRLAPAAAAAQLAARAGGDPWFSAAEIRGLSYLEARVVAASAADRVAGTAGIGAPAREALAEALRVELFVAVERIHAEGGRESSGWFYEEWPQIAARAVARAGEAIPPDAEVLARLREVHR